jgi:hypothetical protein
MQCGKLSMRSIITRKNKSNNQSIEIDSSNLMRSKDDGDSTLYNPEGAISLIDDRRNSVQAGNNRYLVKSVCSADDYDQMVAHDHFEEVKHDRSSNALFQPIFEEDQEQETTQRNTNLPMLDELEREHAAEALNVIQNEVRMVDQSINETENNESSKGSILKGCLKTNDKVPYNDKMRQNSHQTVNIRVFRENLTERQKGYNQSFAAEKRFDIDGNPIVHGAKYKIKFADEIKEEDERKHSLATTHYVQSYKKYNAPTCMERCCTIF